MAAVRTRNPRRKVALLAFESLHIEGALLAPEWLAKVARLDAPHQSESDYRIPRGLNLRDEIGRFWRVAQAHFGDYAAGGRRGADRVALADRFVRALLTEVFGFTLSATPPVVIAGRTYPIGTATRAGTVPVVIAPSPARQGDTTLDTPSTVFGEGGRKRTPFGLVQEVLNASPDMLWGLVCDGDRLRIVRDNASLTRPSWIEADLQRMFTEERFADFAALWLLTHESRFGVGGAASGDRLLTECPLEAWREAGKQEGTRALGHLRGGVTDALVALGGGFLSHPDNHALRQALEDGSLSKRDYFQQLLRLAYRLIFLLTVEERDLLHPTGTPDEARGLYADGYGLRRLRERSARRSAHDRHDDLWEGTKVVLRALDQGEPRLGLPALGGLFAARQCAAIDGARLENRHLLLAVFKLSWMRDAGSLARVNWRDMGPEELGSVYESLLELEPDVSLPLRSFRFSDGLQGNARKTTGSYYTPDSLVQVLLDSALEPVVRDTIAARPRDPADALLELSIVDPACGSGHFLLGAARRLAAHVARVEKDGTPSAVDYRRALRKVVGRCIYGVDLNPMAVELCKVALWMEAVEPGLPLGFLDAHIRCGNALLGTTPELMAGGVPDAAFGPIEGDDKKTASSLKKRNKKEAAGQTSMVSGWSKPAAAEVDALRDAVAALDAAPDGDAKALAAKEAGWAELQGTPAWRHAHLVADAWCAAFVWPKPAGGGAVVEAAPTDAVWRDLRDGKGQVSTLLLEAVAEIAAQYGLFHWHLAFSTVFGRGGFDVVLGNPPWDHVELKEQEFFAEASPEIAGAVNAAARKRLIAELPTSNPQLWRAYASASREIQGQNKIMRETGRFPLCAVGRINTYALFAEHNRLVLCHRGRAGFIVPTGIATDDTTKAFFGELVRTDWLRTLFDFRNNGFFEDVAAAQGIRFCLLTLGAAPSRFEPAKFLFRGMDVRDIHDITKLIFLTPSAIAAVNPNTLTCPTYQSQRDADLNLALYGRAKVLWRDGPPESNPWQLRFIQGTFNMATDSGRFRSRRDLEGAGWVQAGNRFVRDDDVMLPLYEAKMVHHFDDRFGDYALAKITEKEVRQIPQAPVEVLNDPTYGPVGRYWVDAAEVGDVLAGRWQRGWLLGWRDITSSIDQRTVIASLIPRVAVGHTTPLMFTERDPRHVAALYANLCSYGLDYAARQKVGGTHMTYGYLKQLPVLAPTAYDPACPWSPDDRIVDWLLPRVLELTYTAWDLESFAHDVGYDGPPFRWDPARRTLLRAELDAAFFHLYGLNRDDTDYILDTFPIVRKNDEKAHGEYRTKRLILQVYDAMAEAIRTGQPYQTRLAPAPAHPSVAHDPSTRPAWSAPLERPRVAPPGIVVPLPIRRPTPLTWGPDLVPAIAARHGDTAGAWASPMHGDLLLRNALAAVLRALPGPWSAAEVRRAMIAVLYPDTLPLDAPTTAAYRRLVGEADFTRPVEPIGDWPRVLNRAHSQGILSFRADGRWEAGTEVDDAPHAGLTARATFVVAWMISAERRDEVFEAREVLLAG
jgi:hypothetical protein